MNALQFQDITTQQINSIVTTIDSAQEILGELLKGFANDGIKLRVTKQAVFDPNAEFDFVHSAVSQRLADDFIEKTKKGIEIDESVTTNSESTSSPTDNEEKPEYSSGSDCEEKLIFRDDVQPDINSILTQLNSKDNRNAK